MLFSDAQKKPALASSQRKKFKPQNKKKQISASFLKPIVDKKPTRATVKDNIPTGCKARIEILCVNSAYENLLSIIDSKEDYFDDFAGIWRAIFSSAEVEKNFRSLQRERGPLLSFALKKNQKKIVTFLLNEASSFEAFASEDVANIQNQCIEFALKEHRFDLILCLADKPAFDASKPHFLLHDLVKRSVPVYVVKGLLKEGQYEACTRDTYHLSILDYAIVLKNQELIDFLIETKFCDINEPAGHFFSAPIYLAIRTGEIEIVKSVLSHPDIVLNQCSLIFKSPLDFVNNLLNDPKPLGLSNSLLSKEFLLECHNLLEEASSKNHNLLEEVSSKNRN